MTSFEPKPFGRYFLVERIAVGGMAEIYKAKTFGVDGFEKLIAIKKILAHYSADKEFIAMLSDEAKLVVKLSHTNIVQVYDLGRVGDAYFISMEYIDGVNLREFINQAKDKNLNLDTPVCLYIISEICKGLDYAHNRRDEQGNPLGIIHRDVSPQNILLSYEGETKIVDFGIAKAAMNVAHTTKGILKGKISYMAPEQALGQAIDHRIDIFSAGILLYELLTGARLFQGEGQFEVLRKIREARITLAELPDSIPPQLKKILVKALAHDPDQRYDTAGDLQIDLTKLLYSNYPDFSPKRLSQLMLDMFREELSIKKIQAQEEASVSLDTRTELLQVGQQNSVLAPLDQQLPDHVIFQDTTKPQDALRPEDLYHGDEPAIPKYAPAKSVKLPRLQKKSRVWALLSVLGLILASFLGYGLWQKKTPSPIHEENITATTTGELAISSAPNGASISIDGADSGQKTPATLRDLTVKRDYQIRLEKDGFIPWEKQVYLDTASLLSMKAHLEPAEILAPPIPEPTLPPEEREDVAPEPVAPEPAAEPTVEESLPLKKGGEEGFSDEKVPEMPLSIPADPLNIPADPLRLIPPPSAPPSPLPPLKQGGQKGGTEPVGMPPVMIPTGITSVGEGIGQIRIDSQPRGAAVTLDGQKAGITPLMIPELALGTSGVVTVAMPGYQTWIKSFTLSQNRLELRATLIRE